MAKQPRRVQPAIRAHRQIETDFHIAVSFAGDQTVYQLCATHCECHDCAREVKIAMKAIALVVASKWETILTGAETAVEALSETDD